MYAVSPESTIAVSISRNVSTIRSNVTFYCGALGGPQNTYLWIKDEDIIGNESTLVITEIDASSGGSYTCSVSNAAGNDSASTTLYVAPYIVTPLEEQTLTANGSNVNINCNAAGFPSPTVIWVDMTNVEASNTSLLQFSPVMFGYEGVYRCVATAQINDMTFTAEDETIFHGMCCISTIINFFSKRIVINMYYDTQFLQKAVSLCLYHMTFQTLEAT